MRRLTAVFFAATFLLLLAFSPGRIGQMGYMPEILEAGRRLFEGEALTVPRHGLGELAAALPFLGVARILFGSSGEWADRVLSVQPILATALICTVLFAWTRRLTGSPVWGAVLGLLAGFSTMLWPYAYIGLETTQSLFVLLAASVALEGENPPTWKRSLLFAVCAAVAVAIKTASVFLAPAVAWLAWCLFRPEDFDAQRRDRMKLQAFVVVLVVALVWALNTWTRLRFWSGIFKLTWVVAGPLDFVLQAWSALLSVNKGLLVFSPILVLAAFGLGAAYERHRRLVTFAVLVLGGQLFGACLMVFWSDETWGPRYLHSSVAPLVLCLAAARAGRPFRVRRELSLLVLGAAGVLIGLLGSLFWYGRLNLAAQPALVSTIENYQYDIELNHIRFNTKLARVWLDEERAPGYDLWPPRQIVWYARSEPPPGYRHRRQISLAPFAIAQPALLQPGPLLPKTFWLAALVLGTGCLVWLVGLVRRAERARS